MPWKETSVMKERFCFVMDLKEGEASMAELCREYGISRPTGYQWLERYERWGVEGLYNWKSIPHRQPAKTSEAVREGIIEARQKHPRWGPAKLGAWLRKKRMEITWPSASTIGKILQEAGLSKRQRQRRGTPSYPLELQEAERPHDIWCIDFKGWFRTGDGSRCDPLTLMDQFSRFLIACESSRICGGEVQPILERCFREHGMPSQLRSDKRLP